MKNNLYIDEEFQKHQEQQVNELYKIMNGEFPHEFLEKIYNEFFPYPGGLAEWEMREIIDCPQLFKYKDFDCCGNFAEMFYQKCLVEKIKQEKAAKKNKGGKGKQMNIKEAPPEAEFCLEDNIGFVSLVQQNGTDTMIVNSARVSFGKRIEQMEEKDEKLIRFLLAHHHGTPLEHTSLTFLVKCPLFVARQWHRHRVGVSINEISARYVEVKDEFYIPKVFRNQSKSNRQASTEANSHIRDLWQESINHEVYQAAIDQSYQAYLKLIEAGVAREQARGILPLSSYTQFYWTCNLRSLFHFVRLRDHADAQWEIQKYAQAMLRQAEKHFPETVKIWKELGRP